jgi:hypothetical protein
MMRLVLVGIDSFIARHMHQAALDAGIDVFPLPFDADLAPALNRNDTVINFALNPAYFSGAYAEENDCDLRTWRC